MCPEISLKAGEISELTYNYKKVVENAQFPGVCFLLFPALLISFPSEKVV